MVLYNLLNLDYDTKTITFFFVNDPNKKHVLMFLMDMKNML